MDYYVDTLTDKFGYNEVHAGCCKCLPDEQRRLFLGDFEKICSAINVAKIYFFPKAKECSQCCNTRSKT